jgi:hypothetical protein
MYWDARYALGLDGHIVATFWTYDRKRHCDANVHLSESYDGGHTWTGPRDSGLTGQVCFPVLLNSSRLLLLYVDRFRTRSIRAALSYDLGHTFMEEVVVYQHPAAQAERGKDSTPADYLQDMELWTFGRVEAMTDGNGTVWLVYYAGDAQATHICWTRLQVPGMRQEPSFGRDFDSM